MALEGRTARLAVLIDADNTSPRIAVGLFEEIAKIGEASVRRIYGDFSGTRLKSWADILAQHAIVPHQNFAYTTGKNASDIALVIDAMDLLSARKRLLKVSGRHAGDSFIRRISCPKRPRRIAIRQRRRSWCNRPTQHYRSC